MILKKLGLRGLALATVAVVALPLHAEAQQIALEEIVVTARKRSENLQDIPIAISAFSADDIDRAGFTTLEDLSLQVAGMQFSAQSGALAGRLVDSIRFRGMNVDSTLPTEQLGALFVDGIYVLGGSQSIPFLNIDRVEVIKGPQSAYFGRSTFGGAVNYVTSNPSLTDFEGKVMADASTHEQLDISASLDIPLVQDVAGLRLGARAYTRGGLYRASDGGELGEESSFSIDGTFYAEPNDNLWIKARAFYAEDSDGPPAAGYIQGENNDSCSGLTLTSKAGETFNPVRWFCGKVPEIGEAISAFGTTKIIDSNTTLISPTTAFTIGDPFAVRDFFAGLDNPLNVPTVNHVGMERRVHRYSLAADYTFDNEMSLFGQFAYNETGTSWIRDFTASPFDGSFTRDPREQQDLSGEVRLSSNQEDRLRWLAGLSYYEQDFTSSTTGGDATLSCLDYLVPGLPHAPTASSNCLPNFFFSSPGSFRVGGGESDQVETKGVFGSVEYDLNDQFTFTFEARYQEDSVTKGTPPDLLTVKYKAFLPRAILRYQPTEELTTYISYAKGVLPGTINQELIIADAQELVQYQAQYPNAEDFLSKQLLDMYELGIKQTLWDDRVSYSFAAYFGKWTNPVGRATALIQETCDAGRVGSGGCRFDLGEGTPGGLATLPDGSPFLNSRVFRLGGEAEIYGLEFEGSALLSEGWTTDVSIAWAPSEYKTFEANFVEPYGVPADVSGNSINRYPEWTGSISSTYTTSLNNTWDGFVRADVVYFGKTFPEVDNLAYCDDYITANARVGIEKENLRLEAYVKNMFNDQSWTACQRFSDFDGIPINFSFLTAYQGIQATPQVPRHFGIRTSLNF
ncbi:MAG: TonB-dependent receptor [Rhodospirillaceae bacterium]